MGDREEEDLVELQWQSLNEEFAKLEVRHSGFEFHSKLSSRKTLSS